jgi:small subunit ribosomal protein S16
MVRLRLRRVGRKKQPSYRLVAADREAPRDGKFLEIIGFYNPRTEPATIQFKEDRIYDWMSKGAQPSDSVDKLFKTIGLWERYERFKAGEDLEKLLEEARVAEESRNVSLKTRRDAPVKKAAAKAEEPAPEAKEEPAAEEAAPEVVEEPVVEEEAAPEAEEEPAAEEEAAPEAEEEPAAGEEAAPEAEEEPAAEEEAAPETEEESAEE